jgi:hypothetical protein
MARPHKAGIDYFPLDTSFDNNIELLKMEFGARAIGVLIGLYQKIYAHSYYSPWNADILMLFAHGICEEKELIETILTRAMERTIFNRELFETHGIITSANIQHEYLRICKQSKRKQVVMIDEYCLVEDSDLLSAVTEMKTLQGNIIGLSVRAEPPVLEAVLGGKGKQAAEALLEESGEHPLQQEADLPREHDQNQALRTAIYFSDKIKKNNPRVKTPTDDPHDPLLTKWIKELTLLHQKGPYGATISENRGYSWPEITSLIDYSQDDNFWAAHVLCPAVLRKKAITLETKMKTRRSKPDDQHRSKDNSKCDMLGRYRKFAG